MSNFQIDYNQVAAIIPARGGSKGVPGKNILSLGGFPLIAYSIAAAKMTKLINRVIVSTDSEEIAEVAKQYGAEVPFIRPAEISGDRSTDYEFMNHAVEWFIKHETRVPEYWVHLRPTTPLREAVLLDEAVKISMDDAECHCLRSAHEAPESPFKWFIINDRGLFSGITNAFTNEELNNPRQQFPAVYIPDGYVDVLKTSFILKNKAIHGPLMKAYISPFCTEVDTASDFEYLEFELKNKEYSVRSYLTKYYGDK